MNIYIWGSTLVKGLWAGGIYIAYILSIQCSQTVLKVFPIEFPGRVDVSRYSVFVLTPSDGGERVDGTRGLRFFRSTHSRCSSELDIGLWAGVNRVIGYQVSKTQKSHCIYSLLSPSSQKLKSASSINSFSTVRRSYKETECLETSSRPGDSIGNTFRTVCEHWMDI